MARNITICCAVIPDIAARRRLWLYDDRAAAEARPGRQSLHNADHSAEAPRDDFLYTQARAHILSCWTVIIKMLISAAGM